MNTPSGGGNNYVSSLMPYLNFSNSAAGGIANVNTGLGAALNANQNNIGQLGWAFGTGIGNANANQAIEDQAAAAAPWNLLLGLGGMKTSNNGTVGGNLLSGILGKFLPSDERLKENVAEVGSLNDGLPVYLYNYNGDQTPRIGLMAQDVEKVRPDAVAEIGGFKAVHYGRATELAAALSRFADADNVVEFPRARETYYASGLTRFLEAA
jgi:hypothetical protein